MKNILLILRRESKALSRHQFWCVLSEERAWHWSHYPGLRVQTDLPDCIFPIILINKHSIYGKVI